MPLKSFDLYRSSPDMAGGVSAGSENLNPSPGCASVVACPGRFGLLCQLLFEKPLERLQMHRLEHAEPLDPHGGLAQAVRLKLAPLHPPALFPG